MFWKSSANPGRWSAQWNPTYSDGNAAAERERSPLWPRGEQARADGVCQGSLRSTCMRSVRTLLSSQELFAPALRGGTPFFVVFYFFNPPPGGHIDFREWKREGERNIDVRKTHGLVAFCTAGAGEEPAIQVGALDQNRRPMLCPLSQPSQVGLL